MMLSNKQITKVLTSVQSGPKFCHVKAHIMCIENTELGLNFIFIMARKFCCLSEQAFIEDHTFEITLHFCLCSFLNCGS